MFEMQKIRAGWCYAKKENPLNSKKMLRPAIRRALRRLCREFLACEPNADLRVYVHRAMRRVRKGLGDDRLVLKLSERCRSTAFGARFACLADSDSSVWIGSSRTAAAI